MKTTEENNKLIAKFMGAVFHKHINEWYDWDGLYMGESLRFDTSWDWLMPVVEKIENIQDDVENNSIRAHKFDVEIRQHCCTIHGTEIEVTEMGSKILCVYYAVVEFIEWYNNQD